MDWRKKMNPDENNSHFQSNFDWIRKMNNAIAYIENNLNGEIDYREAAKIAYCSVYHFQRFFSFIAEIPLSEYIRRRRLTLLLDMDMSRQRLLPVLSKTCTVSLPRGQRTMESSLKPIHV